MTNDTKCACPPEFPDACTHEPRCAPGARWHHYAECPMTNDTPTVGAMEAQVIQQFAGVSLETDGHRAVSHVLLMARAQDAAHAALTATLTKINAIRNSIIGAQTLNWSEHVYPLVAALNEAGFEGEPFRHAAANVGTTLERIAALTAERDALVAALETLPCANEIETLWMHGVPMCNDSEPCVCCTARAVAEAV